MRPWPRLSFVMMILFLTRHAHRMHIISRSAFGFVRPFTAARPHASHSPESYNVASLPKSVHAGWDNEAPAVTVGNIDLPPLGQWSTYFAHKSPGLRERVSVRNPATAAAIAESFVPKGSLAKVVLEAYPGPGALTRALLRLPRDRIRKLIVLEDHGPYLDYLRPLEQVDSRVHVVPMPGFSWDAYVAVEDMGLLDDVERLPWKNGLHSQLQFISHLPRTVLGEQLVAQLFRGIPEKSWLFKYGRVPMNFILSDWVWQRISAARDHPSRCKLSVIAEAVSNVRLSLPPACLQPYEDHFHPVYNKIVGNDQKPDKGRTGNAFQAIDITPRDVQFIRKGMLDKWDYCLRHLFVLKSKPLKTAITHLAPGAQVLLKEITNTNLPESAQVDIRKQVRRLTIAEWSALIEAFDKWPFAPEDLSIADSFAAEERT